jgi:hypothetical protein
MSQSSILTMEKMGELFKSEGLNLSVEQLGKCYAALEGFYEEIKRGEKKVRKQSGYMLWLKEKRESLKLELGSNKVTEVAKLAGERWKGMSEEEKLEWNEKAGNMEVSREVVKKSKWVYDVTENYAWDNESYEGWSGVHEGSYLQGKTELGFVKGKGVFASLPEAIEAGNELGKGCGGIVKGKSGYSLRLSGEVKKEKDSVMGKFVKCWVKSDLSGVATYAGKKSSKKVAKIQKKMVVELEEKVDKKDETKDEKKDEKKEEKKEEVEAEEILKEESENEEVEEEEEEESGDEEEMSLERYTFRGVTYFYDTNTNLVYDPETQDEIGIKKGNKIILNE